MDLTGDHDESSEKMIGGDSEETNWRQHVLTDNVYFQVLFEGKQRDKGRSQKGDYCEIER